jgi:sugar lactone lactonase YvrE
MRRVKADGTIETFVEQGLGIPHSMVRAKDGGYLLACPFVNKIIRVAPDGTTSDVAGSGSIGDIVADPKKSGLNKPESVAYGADGTLYIGESPKGFEARARLLAISPQGVMSEVDIEAVRKPKTVLSGIAGLADGTLYVADGNNSRLLKRAPGGAWEELPATFGQSEYARLLLDPQGRVLLADTGGNRIARLKADGSLETIAGTGQAGSDGDGGPATRATLNQPSGMYFDAKGTFYVVETGSSLVRAIDTAGTIRTVAGSQGVIAQGDALTIPVNSPTAMAFDAEGRLVISETSGNTVKRLEDGKLVVIAGTIKGYSGDGGPATAAKLDTPTGIAIGPKGELMVMDSSNYVARRVNPDGTIETVAGTGERGRTKLRSAPAKTQQLDRPTGVAFDLQGRPVWADNANHQILRLNPDGTLEVIVGKAPVDDEDGGDAGDGGPATEAALKLPLGVTYDSKGNLYICDTGNMRVRKVSPDGVITTVAGVPLASALGKLLGGLPKEEGIKATEAALVGPAAICVAPTGEIYFSESGTASLSALGDLSQLGALPIALPEIGARIRKIALDGTITTIAGQGGKVLTDKSGDNSLNRPIGLLIDAKGRLVICDAGNSQIKMLPKGSF